MECDARKDTGFIAVRKGEKYAEVNDEETNNVLCSFVSAEET
jgi:hypothetical protein